MFKSPRFNTVVFSREELLYWIPQATVAGPFFPTLVTLTSEWETHSVILTRPEGALVLSAREGGWEDALDKALREILMELRDDLPKNEANRVVMKAFIGARRSGNTPATGLFVLPEATALDHFRHFVPHDFSARAHRVTAAEAVANAAQVAPHLRTMGSGTGPPARTPPARPAAAAVVAGAL